MGLGLHSAGIDYLPFGEEIAATVNGRTTGCYETLGSGGLTPTAPEYPTSPDSTGDSLKFTGKERDAETGLDYFGARYFSAAQGRWTSPDWSDRPEAVPYADLHDPQTLDLYSYLRNNPLASRDLDGHGNCEKAAGGDTGKWMACKGVSDAIAGFQAITLGAKVLFMTAAASATLTTVNGLRTLQKTLNYIDPPHPGVLYGVIPVGPPGESAATGGGLSRVVTLLEEDAGAVDIQVKSAKGTYEVMANMRWEGKTLILDRTHIAAEGGVSAIGSGIRTELREAAIQFGKQQGASEVVINPGVRLGGLGPVAPIRVKVN